MDACLYLVSAELVLALAMKEQGKLPLLLHCVCRLMLVCLREVALNLQCNDVKPLPMHDAVCCHTCKYLVKQGL